MAILALLRAERTMRDIQEVLRQKEAELRRLEKEIEALRIVAPLLNDEGKEAAVSEDRVAAAAAAASAFAGPHLHTPHTAPALTSSKQYSAAQQNIAPILPQSKQPNGMKRNGDVADVNPEILKPTRTWP